MMTKSTDATKVERITRFSDVADEPLEMLMPIEGYENKPLVCIEEATAPLIGIVHDVKRRTWIAGQRCQKPPANGLSIDESTSILLYTMGGTSDASCLYRTLNAALRAEDREKLKPWFLYLKLFMTALARLPSIHGTIYRGVKSNLSGSYPENRTHIWWGFSSCTLFIKVLECEEFLGKRNSRTMFAIDCHSAKDIREHSFYRKEEEVLLPAARQVKVVSCLDAGGDLHIVQLKEIDPLFPLLEPVILPPLDETMTPVSPVKEYIRQCPPSSAIHLWLYSLNDDDMDFVVHEGVENKQCIELSVWGNDLTSQGAAILAKGLQNNTALSHLYLSNNCISDVGVHSLTEILAKSNATLKMLDLGNNGITDLGAQYLAEMLRTNTTLLQLVLSGNKISDRGVQLLARVQTGFNSSLEELYLSRNPFVCSSTVNILVEMLLQNQSLRKLFLQGCSLSQSDLERLHEIATVKDYFSLYV